MKKRDFILIIMIIFLAAVVWIMTSVLNRGTGGSLLISVDSQKYGVYDLNEDQVISIGDTNACQIQDGEVSMIFGDCPDKVCVHSAGISKNGQTIICMPNKIVLEIVGSKDSQIDTMVE